MTDPRLVEVIEHTQAVLLDFDGPVCSAFAGYPSPRITEQVKRELSRSHPASLNQHLHRYPLHTLRQLAGLPKDVHDRIESIIQSGERRAVDTARPTPGVGDFLIECQRQRIPVVIVTNNCAESVHRYLARLRISQYVAEIFARDTADPTLMKPHPHLVRLAVEHLRRPAPGCVLIGDSTTDVTAARAAGVRSVGYANKPGKSASLERAGADAVVSTMADLTAAIRATAMPAASRQRHPWDSLPDLGTRPGS